MAEQEIVVKLTLDSDLKELFEAQSKAIQTEAGKTQSSINAIGNEAKGNTAKGFEVFGSMSRFELGKTGKEFTKFSGELQMLGTNVIRGDLVGSIITFARIGVTAVKSLSIEVALATGGISVALGAVALLISRIRTDAAEVKRLQEEVKADQEKIAGIEIELMRNDKDRETELLERWYDKTLELLAKNAKDKEDLFYKENGGKVKSVVYHYAKLKEMQIDNSILLEDLDKEYAQRKLDIEDKYYWIPLEKETDSREKENLAKTEASKKKELERVAEKERNDIAELKLYFSKVRGVREENEKKQEAETKTNNKARLDSQMAASEQHLKEVRNRIDKENQMLADQANRMEEFAMAMGSALVAGLGKGSEGLKISFKAILTTMLSAIERETLIGYVGAGARALMGDYTGLFQMAGVTAAFEAAKVGVASFALGGDFVTRGPQMIMVGDNPGGRERVSVTPLSSQNVNGPSTGNINMGNVYIQGSADSSTVKAINQSREKQLKNFKKMFMELTYANQMP